MGMLKLILFVLGLNGIKGMSSPCDKFPAVFLLDGSHFTPPSGCRIVSEQSFNPFHDIRKNMYLPRKDLLQKGNLFVYRRIQLFSEMENITFVKKLVLTKLSTCSSIRKIQELNFQVMENTPSSEPIDVLPIFIKSQACPKFYCLIDSKNSHRLSLKTSNQSIHLFSIYSFDREIMGSLSFQIVCRTKGNSTSKIKFQSTLNIRDVDDNSPIPQSELFHNHSYEVQLYNENIKKGTYFKFDEIFYDADLPNTNSYTLNFPKIDYLSNDKKLGTFDFNCGTKYIYKKENVYCQKLPSNFSGTILYLKDQKIYFLKDLRNFRSTNIMGVIMNENQEKVSNFSFKLLASSISPSPMILHTNHSYSLYVLVNDPYLTRIGTLTNFERLTLHKSNCPWFSIADNIIYLDIKGGLKEQGVHPGDTCKLELKSNSSIRINVIINVRESLSLCSNPRSRTTLACSEFSLMEECVSICGPVTSICEWSPENKTLGRSYSTCTVGTKYCPDDKCDALEQLSPNICPQDCQEPEQFRGFNILIDKINNRPIARKSGVVVSCHGKCSAVMKSQAHSMKDELKRRSISEHTAQEYAKCGILCTFSIVLAFFGSFFCFFLFYRYNRSCKSNAHREFSTRTIKDQMADVELVKEQEKYEMHDDSYDEKWEFQRSNLVLEETIGEGEFGKVVSAKAFNLNKKNCQRVAVKMLKVYHTREQLHDLLSEYAILKEVNHPNVIKLLGACTKPDGPLLIIIEFAKYGSVRFYLRSQRKLYLQNSDSANLITPQDVIGFSLQIAKGMEYLFGLKFVHRDLAARNVLLTEGYQCKISDFGLTRDVYTYQTYWKKSNGKLPVKWLSPESLFDNKYTSKSDVWSFGILLWELVTFGGCPYPGIPPERLVKLLKSGYRMEKPDSCTGEIYEIMTDCWSYNPDARPTFKNLIMRIEILLQDATKYFDIFPNLVNNKIYLEPICSSSIATDDLDNESVYDYSKDSSTDKLLSKEIHISFDDSDKGFSRSPPSIKYSQLIHKQSEESLPSIVV